MAKMINIGYGNMANVEKITSIVKPESAPIKRMVNAARDRGLLIDATVGRRTRAVIFTDCEQVILSAVNPETLVERLEWD